MYRNINLFPIGFASRLHLRTRLTSTFTTLRTLTNQHNTIPTLNTTLTTKNPYQNPNNHVIPPHIFTQHNPIHTITTINTNTLTTTHNIKYISILLTHLYRDWETDRKSVV